MENITRKEAIERLAALFEVTETRGDHGWFSMKGEDIAEFFIDKRYMWRMDVIEKLQTFFADKFITDGQCAIHPLTLVWTTFKIEPVSEEMGKSEQMD